MKFRKRPVVIEAVQFDGNNWAAIGKFVGVTQWFRPARFPRNEMGRMIVAEVYDELHDTFVGVVAGDWIIRGLKGEFYPCEPIVFADSYEAVSDSALKILSGE